MVAVAPDSLSPVEAASAPLAAVTAFQMLFKWARLTPGQRVLIHGAAGSVGRYAIQMARAARLRTFASAAPAHTAELKALGAEQVIDDGQLADLRVDALLDLAGGDTQDGLFPCLRSGGKLISAVAAPSTQLAEKYKVHAEFMLVDMNTFDLNTVAHMFDSGTLRPWVGPGLPLSEAAPVHHVMERQFQALGGKIVLWVGDGEW